jgi:hypothetical protein
MERTKGRYSRNIPKNLLKDYEAGLSDPNLTHLRDDIALFDSRINELLGQIESGEDPDIWLNLRKEWAGFMDAVRSGDAERQNNILPRLNRLILRGASKTSAWKELGVILEKRRKLVESEQKRMVSTQQMIAVDQVMRLMAATIDALRRVVNKHVDSDKAHVIFAEAAREHDRLLGPVSRSPNSAVIDVDAG